MSAVSLYVRNSTRIGSWGLHYKYVQYNDFVRFSFTFLCFFILVVAYSNKMPRYHRDHRVMRPIYDCPENNVSAIIPLKLQHLRSQKSA